MVWQLVCAGFCLLLSTPIVRGLLAVHSLEQRASFQRQSLILARALHRPLYTICLLLLLLRATFLVLITTSKVELMGFASKMAAFWLLDMPSVAITMLNGYIVLFAVRLVFQRRWTGSTVSATSGNSGLLSAVFVAFGASLVALVTLVAICRAQGLSLVPQWMTFGYSATIWTTLGLLMLKYGGLAVQILWRHRRRNQWRGGDGEELEKRLNRRLPVLSIACLKNLAVCSTLLAEILVFRGVLCAVAASQNFGMDAMHTVIVDSWRGIILHYCAWEVASVVIVLHMLHQTPIAVHCCSGEPNSAEHSPRRCNEIPSAPKLDACEIQFQVPNVRGLVADYVVPSNTSLLSARRRGMEHENVVEHCYCRVHHIGAPSEGVEYVNCRCHHGSEDDHFSSTANVPLLTEDYDDRFQHEERTTST